MQNTFVIAANMQNDNAPLAPPKVQAPPIGQNLQQVTNCLKTPT